jgi:tartrate-resistant acid phosphatase type 5
VPRQNALRGRSRSKDAVVKSLPRNTFARLLILILFLVSVNASLSQSHQGNSARFLVISDEGGAASEKQRAVAEAMARQAERIKAQFVVTAGDNYHVDGIASADDKRWRTEFEEVYSSPALQIPWYPSLGNHDYRGSVDAEIEYSRLSTRWRLPSRYYSHLERIDDSDSILIVHLDTSPFIEKYRQESAMYHMDGQDAKRQLVWLDSVLTVTRSRWTIVVGHHAIYFAEPGKGDSKEMIDQVLPVLRKHRVPLYVSGHYHFLQHLRRDTMDFVISGGGGAETGDVAQRDDIVFGIRSLGFLSVIATPANLHIEMRDQQNSVLHTVEIAAQPIR